jgi:hypothetical protein
MPSNIRTLCYAPTRPVVHSADKNKYRRVLSVDIRGGEALCLSHYLLLNMPLNILF